MLWSVLLPLSFIVNGLCCTTQPEVGLPLTLDGPRNAHFSFDPDNIIAKIYFMLDEQEENQNSKPNQIVLLLRSEMSKARQRRKFLQRRIHKRLLQKHEAHAFVITQHNASLQAGV